MADSEVKLDDLDHGTRSPVVDISTIENQKENIQPIASGRSAAQLSSLFQTGLSNSQSVLSDRDGPSTSDNHVFNPLALIESLRTGHEKFQKDIELVERAEDVGLGDLDLISKDRVVELMKDPLEIYVQYVRWIIESYPSGGTSAESKLIPLLERSTRKFVTDQRYHHDLRYLKLWVYYSHQVQPEAGRTIFSFLLHKKIGLDFSLLYEEFSNVLIHFKDYEKARQILELGIERKASPIERLVSRLEDLKDRITSGGSSPRETSSDPTTKPKLPGLTKKAVKGKMKIFEDGANGQTSVPGQITRWDDIGTVQSNRKQNTVEPTAWKGQKLVMKPVTVGVTTSRPTKMKIFEDSKDESVSTVGKVPRTTTKTLSEHVEITDTAAGSSEAVGQSDYEILKSDPFRYHKNWTSMNIRML